MKKQQRDHGDFETAVRRALSGKKVPILVLDQRWHTLFPKGAKPSDIEALEERENDLLKRQGFLVNDLKDLKKTKKKLMAGIVAGIGGEESSFENKKKDNQQRLILEINERLQDESDELMDLPRQIKRVNEELITAGAVYCFERLETVDEEMQELDEDIKELRELLNEKVSRKSDLEESMNSSYSLMHSILGHAVMNLYDHRKKKKA